jgi:hypothetical protein
MTGIVQQKMYFQTLIWTCTWTPWLVSILGRLVAWGVGLLPVCRYRVIVTFDYSQCVASLSSILINISAKESSWSDWGSNPQLRQHRLALNTNALTLWARSPFLKKNGSVDSGIQAWYLSTCHAASLGELLYTQCFFKHLYYSESGRFGPPAQGEYTTIY